MCLFQITLKLILWGKLLKKKQPKNPTPPKKHEHYSFRILNLVQHTLNRITDGKMCSFEEDHFTTKLTFLEQEIQIWYTQIYWPFQTKHKQFSRLYEGNSFKF